MSNFFEDDEEWHKFNFFEWRRIGGAIHNRCAACHKPLHKWTNVLNENGEPSWELEPCKKQSCKVLLKLAE